MEKRFLRKDGSVIHAMVTTTFFFDPESDVFRFGVLSVQDISENARIREELDRAYEGAIDALTAALESRDPYTAGHQRRVTRLACAIADEMELPDTTRMAVEVASTLHDIGKIAIPAEILTKPYGVSDAEFSVIKAHPVVAYEILKETHFPWPVADIVLQHHERLDGSGYPAGLRGSAILLEARILSVADTVEALASHRPYRPAVTVPDALDHIVENRSVLFDPDVVDACLRTFESGFRLEETGSPPSTEQTVD
jgi:putative nucleotidyltransferase with HDIG domain